jgi:hypothetical protein
MSILAAHGCVGNKGRSHLHSSVVSGRCRDGACHAHSGEDSKKSNGSADREVGRDPVSRSLNSHLLPISETSLDQRTIVPTTPAEITPQYSPALCKADSVIERRESVRARVLSRPYQFIRSRTGLPQFGRGVLFSSRSPPAPRENATDQPS